jgi:CDP-diacylglycerol--glycerol-3-phosphate 3-phosphatidyltransferase
MGSFSTSYARAKAESLGIECRVGIVERPERFFIVLVLLVSGYVLEFMVLLAILTNITAFQRLLYVKRVIDKK